MAVEIEAPFDALVREDSVHRSLYTDPAIFREEMRRIYGRTWVFACHESEVPNPGDFKTDKIAGRPVLVTRDPEGKVHVLFNTCRHRGSLVCSLPEGNTSYFRCPYHSWTYQTNGELALVPNQAAFGSDFDLDDYGLVPVSRVASYGGFVFLSFSPQGPDLDEHLGRAKHYIDIFLARSPLGAVQATKPLKYGYPGNWKLQMENMSDNYHARYVHASAMTTRRESGRNGGENQREDWSETRGEYSTRELSFGRGFGVLHYRTSGGGDVVTNPERFPDYVAALTQQHGEERARELANTHIHVMIYPNLILHTKFNHYRVVRPLAVDHTEINVYPCKLAGASDEVNRALIKASAFHVSAGGQFQIDDLEAFTRVHQGLSSEAVDWVLFKMRGPDEGLNEDGERETRYLSEMIPRGYYREWRRLMAEP